MTRTWDLDIDEASLGEFAERKPDGVIARRLKTSSLEGCLHRLDGVSSIAQLEYSCGTLIESRRLTSCWIEDENLVVYFFDQETFTLYCHHRIILLNSVNY
jgi:hypothetical protein